VIIPLIHTMYFEEAHPLHYIPLTSLSSGGFLFASFVCVCVCVFFFFFAALGFELNFSHLLCRCSYRSLSHPASPHHLLLPAVSSVIGTVPDI
jgi:hypothetical protein